MGNGIMFNVATGTVGSKFSASANVTGAISGPTNGFYRISITFTSSAGSGGQRIYSSGADWANNSTSTEQFLGDAVSASTIFFGAQLELAASPSAYVATL